MSDLLTLNREWTEKVLGLADPLHGMVARPVAVKDGKARRHDPAFPATLHHTKDFDYDGATRALARPRTAERLRKATDVHEETPGGRWITVHPNGEEEDGYPVYITPNRDGSYTIASGAGGKLNGLRLTDIKSPDEYRKLAKEKRKQKEQALKLKDEQLRQQLGQSEYEYLQVQRDLEQAQAGARQRGAEKEFVGTVARLQGVDPAALELPAEALAGLDKRTAERLQERQHQANLTWAKQVASHVTDTVLTSYSSLSQDQLGDVGLPDIINATTGDMGNGYRAQMAHMAAENGLTDAGKREMQHDVSFRGMLDRSNSVEEALAKLEGVYRMHAAAAQARAETREAARQVADEHGVGPEKTRTYSTTPRVANLADAVEVLKAQKKMQAVQRDVRALAQDLKDVESAAKLPKAAVVLAREMDAGETTRAVADALSQEHLKRAMLRLVGSANQIEEQSGSLGAHLSVGHAAALNALTQAVDGSVVDPLVLDVLGPSAVAQATAANWRRTLPPEEYARITRAIAETHVASQEKIATQAVDRAEGYLADAARIPTDAQPQDVEGVEAALSDHARRVELLRMARESVGVARGRLEATAALNEALLHKGTGPVQVALGPVSTADAMEQVYACGLNDPSAYDADGTLVREGDFTLHSDGANRILEIHPPGLAKLTRPADPARQQRAQLSADIKNGALDDPAWLPAGISRRPASTYEQDPLQARSIDHRLEVKDTDDTATMGEHLRRYIGGLIHDGRDPFTVAADCASADFLAGLGLTEAGQAQYRAALADVAPSYFDAVRQEIAAQVGDQQPGTEAYAKAYADARESVAAKLRPTTPEYTEAFAAHRAQLRKRMEGYADAYVEGQRQAGQVSPDQAALDKQYLPLDDTTQDCLFQAVAADPRTQNAFLPVSEVNRDAMRSYALEKMLGVDPNSQEILSRLTPEQTRAFRAWDAYKREQGAGAVYKAIQADMLQRHEEEAGGSLFGGVASSPPTLATVDLSNPVDVIQTARENGQALGYKLQVDPETGKMDYLELKPGARFYAAGEGGRMVEYGPLTEETIARVARDRIKKRLKRHYLGTMLGMAEMADSNWDPDSVLTASNRWDRYVRHMGGPQKALRAVQEFMAGELQERFAKHYASRTGRSLQVAQREIAHKAEHAAAVETPEEVERKQREARTQYAQVGKGKHGKFVAGSRKQKVENIARYQEEGGTLLGESAKGAFQVPVHRATLGKAAEKALAGMMPYVPADKPIEVAHDVSMAGKAINRQRATRLIIENKRQGLNLGAGSGKTICGVGAFAHLQQAGKARRALFVVPSNIVGQFGGEFLKFLDPASGLRWHADPGASGEERRQALGEAGYHMVVTTPEALREDVTGAVAQDLGMSPAEAVERLKGMDPRELDATVHQAMRDRGWDFDYSLFDESHRLLGRQGKPDAHMARIGDSVGRMTPYYVYSTADVIKNDASEAWDVLHKLAPDKYPESSRDGFLRRHSRNTLASGLALRQEMEPYIYAANVDTGVAHQRHTDLVDMTPPQESEYNSVMAAYRSAKQARATHNMPALVDALQRLAPGSFGKGGESDAETAQRIGRALGTLKETALNRVVNLYAEGAKLDWVARYAMEHKGEPMVVFAHNREAVKMLAERLRDTGHRVGMITGAMGSDAKNKAKLAFQPPSGEPSVDVLVCSDASAMGANLQRGYHLINFDTPLTSMLHEQRIAREVRTGQQHAVSVHDLVANSDFDRRARRRLEQKRQLRELMTNPAEMMDDTGLLARIQAARVERFVRKYSDAA